MSKERQYEQFQVGFSKKSQADMRLYNIIVQTARRDKRSFSNQVKYWLEKYVAEKNIQGGQKSLDKLNSIPNNGQNRRGNPDVV